MIKSIKFEELKIFLKSNYGLLMDESQLNKVAGSEIYPSTSNIQKEIALWEIRISEKEKEASNLSIQIQEIKINL
ncbi:MAG: hypothetical protein JSW07_12580, partial [bacterium]